jgi:hypothetical protein
MRARIIRAAWYGLGAIALVLAAQGQALAGEPVATPEIDGSTLSAGFGLLAAGVLIVRSRMKAK